MAAFDPNSISVLMKDLSGGSRSAAAEANPVDGDGTQSPADRMDVAHPAAALAPIDAATTSASGKPASKACLTAARGKYSSCTPPVKSHHSML